MHQHQTSSPPTPTRAPPNPIPRYAIYAALHPKTTAPASWRLALPWVSRITWGGLVGGSSSSSWQLVLVLVVWICYLLLI
jgi:hypothetical protein